MIPDGHDTSNEDPSNQALPTNVSTQSPTARKVALPDTISASSSAIHESFAMTLLSDVPPRPSTAPPHPVSEPQTELQTRTMLVSNLRARNLLLQKAISHIDDAVLHLMAARSGIPSSKIQQVRGEARNRKDLLARVDRAIKMAQNGQFPEETPGGEPSGESSSGVGNESTARDLEADAFAGTMPPAVAFPPSSDDPLDTPQLRRSSSQPQLGPSTAERQVAVKMYTLPDLIQRRKVLQESIDSWKNFMTELRAVLPFRDTEQLQTALRDAANTSSEDPSSWLGKYKRARFEIKRREDLLVRLNQAITQYSESPESIPTPEQVTTLATYMPPPLDKGRFEVAYERFCQGKSIQVNTSIIMPDVRKPVIDVYALHVAVMQEGSYTRVCSRQSWDLVGGRLGFIHMNATATEPARSSPEIAAHLEKVYKDRLLQFDHLYVGSVIQTLRKRMTEQQNKA